MSQLDSLDEGGTILLQSADEVEFDERHERYRVSYDPSVDDTSLAVVTAVGVASQTDPTQLPPLYDAVDPTGLDTIFTETQADTQVTFRYSDFDVTVSSTGVVTCTPITAG
ncbi:hypothetical protein SAMN04487967_2684 [Natronorubrum sediminis]|uniref:Halobacterial output domain-containing protein n=1 Tax=Natronorubrum sediminis TaxID=640943 RepID=A0A1H6G0B5_9EURY|nr:HalOD1 output domain-containing protein [Natronorubrum sediminis]SEH16526.1 hypothetical protein SAMN04487967_2684 [Natronorubrum sediminis]